MRLLFVLFLLSFSLVFGQANIQGSYLEEDLGLLERHFLGDADAPISVVIFEDFGCPHCQAFNQNLFPDFKESYIDTGFVKFYFFHLPIPVSDYSINAALASECVAEQSKAAFWPYKISLYETSIGNSIYGSGITAFRFWQLAESFGIEQGQFMGCMLEERYANKLQQDRQLGIEAGVNFTPAMLIDTEAILNANDYDLLTRVLNDSIAALD